MPHLDIPVGEQQVDDNVGGEQLHAVQPLLDVAQLVAEVLAAKTLPRFADLVPDGLPEVLAAQVHNRSRQSPCRNALQPNRAHRTYLDWMCTLLSRCTSRSTSSVSSGSNWKLGCINSLMPVITVASQANTLP